ncbi:AAA family ATPase [Pseudomonas protegens]|uniref:AAA family ATPase n=1 Tax=Pseudomonas protegens TaxID=380021 RepID=UPI00380873B9
MHIIESISIKGFWGTHSVNVRVFEDYNFIIGPNGSGKSTALKLMAGVLLADKEYLASLDFDYIKVGLKEPGSRKKPYIEVTKRSGVPFFHCDYKIFLSAGEKPYSYELSDVDGYESLFKKTFHLRAGIAGKEMAARTVESHLSELVSLTWLSVERVIKLDPSTGSDPIDMRLEDFSNRLVRYLSSLNKKVNQLNERFQEQVFLSLLVKPKEGLSLIPSLSKLESDKKALLQIFSEFNVEKNTYVNKVQEHLGAVKELEKKLAKKETLDAHDAVSLFSLSRIERTVSFWEEVDSKKKKLLESKNQFIEMLNGLMQRKTLWLNERNEIVIETTSGKRLRTTQLSSGEKQILIILGEALLQDGQTYIYMADEPEISLHVAWQESLAKNIKKLNPAAQIIFATHSPDVVGPSQASLIRMEHCIE